MTAPRFRLRALLTAALAASGSGFAAPSPAAAPPQPNVLLLIADDLSAEHLSHYGETTIETPNFDRVAREGVAFQHHFCSAPSCSPARGAILTGRPVWQLGRGRNLHGGLPENYVTYHEALIEAGYYAGRRLKAGAESDVDRTPGAPDDFAAFLASVPPGRPFVYWFSSRNPHRPYDPARAGVDPARVRVPPFLDDSPETRADLADYLEEVQDFDREIGVHLDLLRAQGPEVFNRTLILVTSDNGMPFPRAKPQLYDAGTRLPLAIQWNDGLRHPGRRLDDFVSQIDLAPTIYEVTGVRPPAGIVGRSLVEHLRSARSGTLDPARDAAFFGRDQHGKTVPRPFPMRAVRTAQHLYIRNYDSGGDGWEDLARSSDGGGAQDRLAALRSLGDTSLWDLAFGPRPPEELYHLPTDPHQLRNVAADPAFANPLATLRTRLADELARTAPADAGFTVTTAPGPDDLTAPGSTLPLLRPDSVPWPDGTVDGKAVAFLHQAVFFRGAGSVPSGPVFVQVYSPDPAGRLLGRSRAALDPSLLSPGAPLVFTFDGLVLDFPQPVHFAFHSASPSAPSVALSLRAAFPSAGSSPTPAARLFLALVPLGSLPAPPLP